MVTASTLERIRAFVLTLDSRDWQRFAALLHPDVVYEVPQTRERVTGREAYVRFNREFPGNWRLSLVDAYANAHAGVARFTSTTDGTVETAIAFLHLDDEGLVTSITDYWPEPYEPPPGREHLVERGRGTDE